MQIGIKFKIVFCWNEEWKPQHIKIYIYTPKLWNKQKIFVLKKKHLKIIHDCILQSTLFEIDF